MKKKVISLMLASAMVFSLAACGGNDDASPDSSAPASESGSASAARYTSLQKLIPSQAQKQITRTGTARTLTRMTTGRT